MCATPVTGHTKVESDCRLIFHRTLFDNFIITALTWSTEVMSLALLALSEIQVPCLNNHGDKSLQNDVSIIFRTLPVVVQVTPQDVRGPVVVQWMGRLGVNHLLLML